MNRLKLRYGLFVILATFIVAGCGSEQTTTEKQVMSLQKAGVGDLVALGSYEQDGDLENGRERIEWYVMAKENGRALLVSRYLLDVIPYDNFYAIGYTRDGAKQTTWESSLARQWLNQIFYETCFNENEQSRIIETQLVTEDNPEYGTEGGNDTQDKVFLLSLKEVNTYFGQSKDESGNEYYIYEEQMQAKATQYAIMNGLYWIYSQEEYEEELSTCDAETEAELFAAEHESEINNGDWWLRTAGSDGDNTAYVDEDVVIRKRGIYYSSKLGIRPAIWVNVD